MDQPAWSPAAIAWGRVDNQRQKPVAPDGWGENNVWKSRTVKIHERNDFACVILIDTYAPLCSYRPLYSPAGKSLQLDK